jgi:type IV pilus assembly protein PilC
MPEFAYIAVDGEGRRIEGTAFAATEDALAAALRGQERFLVRASEAGTAGGWREVRLFERVTRRDVIFFSSQLATVLSTGISVVDGLRDIEAQIAKRAMRRVVADVRKGIEGGDSLSTAMARHPGVFSEIYVSIVRAGESTGRVDRALEDLVAQLEWHDRLATRIKEALTYPALVVGLLLILTSVLVGFTIPRFAQIYQRFSVQVQLPLPTRIVMGVANFFVGNWYVMLAALAVIAILVAQWAQTPSGSVSAARLLLRVPVLGEVLRKIALSRFAHYFGTLHEAGLEVVPSLTLMERVLGNAFLAQRFHRAVERVMAGESLSRALAIVGEFSPIVIQMVALGENTGQMSKSLVNVRQYYDREVDRIVNQALTLFGPIMLVVLACVFVTMALAFYLPLFSLVRAIR